MNTHEFSTLRFVAPPHPRVVLWISLFVFDATSVVVKVWSLIRTMTTSLYGAAEVFDFDSSRTNASWSSNKAQPGFGYCKVPRHGVTLTKFWFSFGCNRAGLPLEGDFSVIPDIFVEMVPK